MRPEGLKRLSQSQIEAVLKELPKVKSLGEDKEVVSRAVKVAKAEWFEGESANDQLRERGIAYNE